MLVRKEAGGCWLQERGRWMLVREERQVDVAG